MKPVIPATWEAEIGESRFKASLGKSIRPYLKNKIKTSDGAPRPLVPFLVEEKQQPGASV
jgi:hypothetical protein